MPFIVGGAVLGGALISSNASKDASKGQVAAANSATAEQRRQFDLARSDQAPYRDAGSSAIQRLSSGLGLPTVGQLDENDPRYKALLDPEMANIDQQHIAKFGFSAFDPRADAAGTQMWVDQAKKRVRDKYISLYGDPTASTPGSGELLRKFTMQDFQNDPVNQIQGSFMQDEARKAIERRAAAVGGWDSGATLKALTRFGSDYGNQRAGESYNRFVGDQTNAFNRLASVSGIGQTAANTTDTLGANMATNIGNNTMQAANARGAAAVANANSINSGINTGLNYYQGQQFINRLQPQAPQAQTPAWNPYATGDFPAPSQFMNS